MIRKLWRRFRSAVTGRFVRKEYAEANPETTVREERARKIRKLRKDLG